MIGCCEDAEIILSGASLLHHAFLLDSEIVGLLLLGRLSSLHVVLKLVYACEKVRTLLDGHLPLGRAKSEQVLQLLGRIEISLTSCRNVVINHVTIQVCELLVDVIWWLLHLV